MTAKTHSRDAVDEGAIRKELRQAISDTKYLERRWDDLVTEHSDEWVAVYEKEILFAPSLDGLLEKAEARGWDVGLMVIDHLVANRPMALL